MNTFCFFDSPIGALRLVSADNALVRIELPNLIAIDGEPGENAVLVNAKSQLDAYFIGQRCEFDLPIAAHGSEFQQRVWQQLREIPYGQTRSYADIASAIGKPKAVRAVGAANGRNPIPIVVPCHRVIGSNGSLTGFAGGLDAKIQLLKLERADGFLL